MKCYHKKFDHLNSMTKLITLFNEIKFELYYISIGDSTRFKKGGKTLTENFEKKKQVNDSSHDDSSHNSRALTLEINSSQSDVPRSMINMSKYQSKTDPISFFFLFLQ